MSFQPTQIPGCILWLDAADTSTVSLSGTNITAIADKILPSRTFVATTGNFTYIQDQGRQVFNIPNTTLMTATTALSVTASVSWLFVVTKLTKTSGFAYLINFIPDGDETFRYLDGSYRGVPSGGDGNDLITPQQSFVNGILNTPTTYTNYHQINGPIQTTRTTTSITLSSDFNSRFFIGTLCEVIFYNGPISTANRQQIEGYLAWKWAIESSLPADHPYKNFPPTSLTIEQSTEVSLINTTATGGVVTLPSISSLQGRMLTFKDSQGTWGQSSFTLSTVGLFDKFEDGTNEKTFQNRWGSTTLYGGTNNRWFILGGTQLAYGTTNNINTSSIQATALVANQFPVSTISFQNSFSPLNVSTSLFYYGSTILGPTKLQQPLLLGTQRLFQPNQIGGLILWLDGKDLNTIGTSGSFVTQWNDKSGSFKNASFNGNIIYDRSNQSVNTTGNPSFFSCPCDIRKSVTTYCSIFMVHKWLSFSVSTEQTLWGADVGGGWNRFQLLSFPLAPSIAYGLSRGATTPNVVNINSLNTSNRLLYTAQYAYLIPNGSFAFINGSQEANFEEVAASPQTTTTSIFFGKIGDNQYFAEVAYNEIIIYTSEISSSNRQQIEGYLAWKWDLVANLPSDHPYKNSPP